MKLLRIISQRSVDPLFYKRRYRRVLRQFRKRFDRSPVERLGDLGPIQSATVFVAHPDDEVFCSGLICELKESGAFVRVLCLTRGEGGPTGGHTRTELGTIRESEMRESCDALGVDDLVFLDHVDPVAGEFRVYAPDVTQKELADQVAPFFLQSDLVITHGSSGEYWHPGHLLVFKATGIALEHSKGEECAAWMTFLAGDPEHPIANLINKDDAVFLRLDASRHFDCRVKALGAHASQLGLFGRFAGGHYSDFVRKTAVESYALRIPGSLQISEATDESEREDDRASHGGSERAKSKPER